MKVKAKIISGLLGGALVVLPTVGLSSCSLVREDLEECYTPHVALRFIYDYNMEYANAFHNQVDCLTAYFYDENGYLVLEETVTDESLLSDENYRMYPELPAGNYHVVAYGGMGCDKSSFYHPNQPSEGSHYSDLQVSLDTSCLDDPARSLLHNHYYGSLDFTVSGDEDTYATVEMMRNTNSVQVALQHLNGSAIDTKDFIYEITDDNNDFNHENNLLATGEITYNPWNTENRTTGVGEDYSQEWYAALAQFTTSRLVAQKSTPATLHVRRSDNGSTIFRIPLINYMLLFKHNNSGNMQKMTDQEYLDRENSWHFVFFLDENNDNAWVSSRIIVNDWEVRMNSGEF